MTIGTGIHDISPEAYHADPCPEPSLSSSVARILLNQSPRHAWLAHPRLNSAHVKVESDRFDLGTAAHALLLEGAHARLAVIDADDYRTKAAKEARDSARARGLVPVLAKQKQPLYDMVSEAKEFIDKAEDAELAGIWNNGAPEETLVWQEAGGVWCRARLDWLTASRRLILDYKTTTNAEPDYFTSRVMCQMGYDFQAAFYLRGLSKLSSAPKTDFIFLAQEIEPPYCCSFSGCTPMMAEIAAKEVERAISLWGQCIRSGQWPGYDNRIHWAEAPSWKIAEATERGDL